MPKNAANDLGWWPTATDYTSDLANVAQRLENLENALPPIGTVMWWMNEGIPTNYLKCDGSTFDAATYPELNTNLNGTTLPNLKDYMPAGRGGAFGGSGVGSFYSSKIKAHQHTTRISEPGDKSGNPSGSGDSSTSRYRYWRGNDNGSGSTGTSRSTASSEVGDSITSPPVQMGHWVIRAK